MEQEPVERPTAGLGMSAVSGGKCSSASVSTHGSGTGRVDARSAECCAPVPADPIIIVELKVS